MSEVSEHVHATRDGRELKLGEMSTDHLFAAVTSLTKWMRAEADREKQAELKEEIRLMWGELRSRKGRC